MQEKEFNLLDEPWIKVLSENLEIKEVSLKDVFINAHKYKCLAGEIPTMDVAILRVLLAVTVTVFYRYDAEGNEDELSEYDSDPGDVLQRWKEYIEKGQFSESTFTHYLEKYRERFWLFHPETPFFQVPNMQYGTKYKIDSLLGNLKESNNSATKHHFSMEEKDEITKATAARWLIHLNSYAVNIKPDKKAPGTNNAVGTGRLGRMGLLVVNGQSLFHILMLNINALRDGQVLWGKPKPTWEQPLNPKQGIEISSPNNLPEAYTIQSRRIMLIKDSNSVIGFRALGGDYCPLEDAFYEQMTLWKKSKKTKNKDHINVPKNFSRETQAWKEFSTMFNVREEERVPGIVLWVRELQTPECESFLPEQITFRTFGFMYGDGMSYTYGECISDSITLSSSLLKQMNAVWIERITDEVANCQNISNKLFYKVATDITLLLYGKNDDKKKEIKKVLSERYYSEIDQPFRSWLSQIDPHSTQMEPKLCEWEQVSYRTARKVAEEYIFTLNENIYRAKEQDAYVLAIPQILNYFVSDLKSIYKLTGKEKDKIE